MVFVKQLICENLGISRRNPMLN